MSTVDENEHAFARARAWHADMADRNIIRDTDTEAFLYHLALLIKNERASVVGIVGETKGRPAKGDNWDGDCG
jgi:hypothetical protein